MSLWPTFITGVVGVAGILGTIVAARMTARSQTANLMLSINEERGRAQVVDKRQVYARFTASIQEYIHEITAAYFYTSEAEKLLQAVRETIPARSKVYNGLYELYLIAPEEIVSQAGELNEYVMGNYTGTLMDIKEGSEQVAAMEPLDAKANTLQEQLLKIMRADLGGESG